MLASSSALDLSNSNYYRIPSHIPPGESYLNLSGNKLTILRRHEFLSMTNLRFLHLSGNQIASVEYGAFVGLSKLKTLWLSRNKLTSVPDISPLASLQRLGLSANPIKTIESHDLETSTSLEILYIAWTEARHPPPLPFCPNLIQLDLSGNIVKHYPLGFFNRLPSLTKLKICCNKLSSFPQFGDCKAKLVVLEMKKNRIYTIPDLSGYKSLTTLDLSNYYISVVPEGSLSMIAGGTVKLNDNPIHFVTQLCWLVNSDPSFTITATCPDGTSWDDIDPDILYEGMYS